MFGVPIKPFIVLALSVLVLPVLAQAANQHVPVNRNSGGKPELLVNRDKQLQAYEKPYILASSANLVYDRCTNELAITEAEKTSFRNRYTKLSSDYLKAFEDAFYAKWRGHSDAATTKDYARYLSDLRTPALAQMTEAINSLGCDHKRVKVIVDYYRKIDELEAKGKRVALVKNIREKKTRTR